MPREARGEKVPVGMDAVTIELVQGRPHLSREVQRAVPAPAQGDLRST